MIKVKNLKNAALRKNGVFNRVKKWLETRPQDCLYTSAEVAQAVGCSLGTLRSEGFRQYNYSPFRCTLVINGITKMMWGHPKAVKNAMKELAQ